MLTLSEYLGSFIEILDCLPTDTTTSDINEILENASSKVEEFDTDNVAIRHLVVDNIQSINSAYVVTLNAVKNQFNNMLELVGNEVINSNLKFTDYMSDFSKQASASYILNNLLNEVSDCYDKINNVVNYRMGNVDVILQYVNNASRIIEEGINECNELSNNIINKIMIKAD